MFVTLWISIPVCITPVVKASYPIKMPYFPYWPANNGCQLIYEKIEWNIWLYFLFFISSYPLWFSRVFLFFISIFLIIVEIDDVLPDKDYEKGILASNKFYEIKCDDPDDENAECYLELIEEYTGKVPSKKWLDSTKVCIFSKYFVVFLSKIIMRCLLMIWCTDMFNFFYKDCFKVLFIIILTSSLLGNELRKF